MGRQKVINFKKFKNLRLFKHLKRKLKDKNPISIILLISLLLHIFLLLLIVKFAFLKKTQFSFIKPKDDLLLAQKEEDKPFDTKIVFVPDAPVKMDEAEDSPAQKAKITVKEETAEPTEEQLAQLQEALMAQESLQEVETQEEQFKEEDLAEREEEKDEELSPIPELAEKYQPKPTRPQDLEKKDLKKTKVKPKLEKKLAQATEEPPQGKPTIDKEELKKLALANLLNPQAAQAQSEKEKQEGSDEQSKDYTSLLLPQKDAGVVIKMDDFMGIGQTSGYIQGDAPLEYIKQRTKMMCYLNKLFKEIIQNLKTIPNFKHFFVFNPPSGSTIVYFSTDIKGRVIDHNLVQSSSNNSVDQVIVKCIKSISYLPPIPNHLNSDRCDNYIEIKFKNGEVGFSSGLHKKNE